ncbi:MAG TPA: alpha/beta hydrolase domain-containing protein [Candidatus Angelobacter sp.]
MRLLRLRATLILALLVCLAAAAQARVVRVEILSRSDVQDGKAFGAAGAYERITGRVYFAVNPANIHNRQIVDLDKAARNAQGEVEFSADLYLLKPKEMNRGNGAVLFEVSNRGGKGILRLVNGGNPADEVGDGFLMRQGYTVAWVGWEFDVADQNQNLRLYAPVARAIVAAVEPARPSDDRAQRAQHLNEDPGHASDQEIHGLVRSDFTLSVGRDEMPVGHIMLGPAGGKSYAVDNPDSPSNVLTVRDTRDGPRQTIPRGQWSFRDARFVHLNGGFVPGKIYELVYSSKDPMVVGLGMAAVRDFLSYLKHDAQAVAPVARVYAVGISQSGRFLRHFLYQDFNADEQGRRVMDGVIAHVAGAGRGSFNHRFAQPSRDSQPMSSIFFPTDLFPFTDLPEVDPATGVRAGLLDAATKSRTAPKIFFTNTSYEYWGRAASLIHTSADGAKDATLGSNVRVYLLAGLQHFSAVFPPQKSTPGNPDYTAQQRHNPNPIQWFWRALITNMDQWVRKGTQPPPSTYPKIAAGTLVPLEKWTFPAIPGVNLPHEYNLAYHLDFGPQWTQGIISNEPPQVGPAFTVLVPQSDADGNDLGGVRLPELDVPLATYTGWNLRDPSIGAPQQRESFLGSFIPFARTEQERKQSGDPRPAIAERYASREQYLEKFSAAAQKLIHERFLLAEDLPAMVARGQREWEEVMGKAESPR